MTRRTPFAAAAAVLTAAIALVFALAPAQAFADVIVASRVLDELPNVGDTVDLGYGDVTYVWSVGETFEEGDVYFSVHFDDTWNVFGNAIDATNFICIDHTLGALGAGYGGQSWPIQWVGAPTRFKATATVTDVDPATATVTYTVLAYAVRYYNGQETTDPRITGFQRMRGTLTVQFPNVGRVRLHKVSAAPSCTDGNPLYSLAGATYGLYASREDAEADANRLFTFTTDGSGNTETTDWMEAGTYYVKELSASPGYKLTPTVEEVQVGSGTAVFTVREHPYADPPVIWKVDADHAFDPTAAFDGSQNAPQGGATLAGALFEINYYAGEFSLEECAARTPDGTWVVRSNASGFAMLGEAYLVSGDALMIGADGNATLPLGTATIREIAAPEGYKLPADSPTVLVRITPTGPVYSTGYTAAFFEDEIIRGRIEVTKRLAAAGGTELDPSALAGVQVQVVSSTSGACVATLTLDEAGHAVSGLLPYDTYTLVEVASTLPAGVQPYSWTASGGSGDGVFATVALVAETTYGASLTDYTTSHVPVAKVDVDSGEPLAGATFTLYRVPTSSVSVSEGIVSVAEGFDADDAGAWEVVAEQITDDAGYVGFSMLPFGRYRLIETDAPEHYWDETHTQGSETVIVHDFTIDAAHESMAFTIADKRLDIAVDIYEHVIEVTSAALDAGGVGLDNNVGDEEIIYHVGTQNVSSVDTDTFILTTPVDEIVALGLRVLRIWTGTATGDADGEALVLYQTNKNAEWTLWAVADLTTPQELDVPDLGLDEDEYITGLQADFGAVAADFHSGTEYGDEYDWCFSVVATEPLEPEDGPITNSSTAYTAVAASEDTVIWAEAVAEVQTEVIDTFDLGDADVVTVTEQILIDPVVPTGSRIPSTGDTTPLWPVALVAVGAAGIAALAMVLARRRAVREAGGAHAVRSAAAASGRARAYVTVGMLVLVCAGCVTLAVTEQVAGADEGGQPASGAASPAEPAEVTERFTYFEGEEEPAIPETLERDGAVWTLVSCSEPHNDESYEPETRPYAATESGSFASAADAQAAFPETREVEEEGFAGTVTRVSFTYGARLETVTLVADRQVTYGPFISNEVRDLPETITVEVQDAAGSHTETIRRASVTWEVAGTNAVGMPTGYNCVATYRGSVTAKRVVGWDATAVYEGTLVKQGRQLVVEAVYRAPEPVVDEEPVAGPAPDADAVESAAAASGRRIAPLPVAAGSAAAVVAVGILFFLRSRNVTVCSRGDERILARTHARRDAQGSLRVAIPPRVSLAEGAVLYLRENLCDGGTLHVEQAGAGVFDGHAMKRVVIG